jgi:hypothetical protein
MTDIARLSQLAALLAARRDARLADLARAAAARDAVAAQLAALETFDAKALVDDPVAAARQALLFGQWTAAQKITLNRELAARTAVWLTAREAARIDAGRANAMDALLARHRSGRRDQES